MGDVCELKNIEKPKHFRSRVGEFGRCDFFWKLALVVTLAQATNSAIQMRFSHFALSHMPSSVDLLAKRAFVKMLLTTMWFKRSK